MSKTLPISEVKARLPELVTGVAEREEEIVVTRNGRPAAMIVNYDEYRRQRDTLDILSDPVMMKQIRQSQRFFAENAKGLSFEDVFGEPVTPKKKTVAHRRHVYDDLVSARQAGRDRGGRR